MADWVKKYRKLVIKSPKSVPFHANLAQSGAIYDIPATTESSKNPQTAQVQTVLCLSGAMWDIFTIHLTSAL